MRRAALLAALVVIAGAAEITRPGYSVDEEFTEFAVRGIHQRGLPILPSRLLYDRGILYSYAAAVADARLVSLVAAAASVVVTFALVRQFAGPAAAAVAALLVVTSVPFWAVATTGRFYALFLALFLAALAAIESPVALGVLAFSARLTHELAFLLALIPLGCLMLARRNRRGWLGATVAVVAGLAGAQVVLLALHALDPPSGETMVRRFFLWQVMNLFEQPGDRQFGIPLVVLVLGVLLAPRRSWWWWIVGSLSATAMIVAYSVALASNSAPLTLELVSSVLQDGSRYPLDMFWHIAGRTPLTLFLALAGLATRASGLGGPWRPPERAAHLLWIGWVLWFGVIESGITTNYLLLPITFMLIAIAVDIVAIGSVAGADFSPPAAEGVGADFSPPIGRPGAIGRTEVRPYIAITLIVVGIALDQWRGDGSLRSRLEAARPTIDVAGIDEIRDSLQPNDRVVCTDELGCLMLVGRIDRWLALDDFVRERFLVTRANNQPAGVYSGAPAVFRPADIFSPFDSGDVDRALAQGRPLEAGTLPDRTLVVDVFKEYPIGNSRDWLPRAIERDGLQVIPLLETAQVRVLQVSPPEAQARLRGLQPSD